MEQPSDRVDDHIDDFICVRKRGWDIGCFSFDRNPIFDVEGSYQLKNTEIFPLEDYFPYMDDQDTWQPNDDMISDLFNPPGDGLLQYTCVDFQPYLGDYPFEDSKLLFDEDSQPYSCLNWDKHESMKQSETHTTKKQYFCP